ncbi:hypothetical protein HanLR1_Chr03g0082831 [Helianthus annuus]|nr:hypothetical protein HanLR1_Chr03g0082831 [Helianthus annuus]
MGTRKDLAKSFSHLAQEEVEAFCLEWGIGLRFKPVAPGCDVSIDQCPPGSVALYCRHFEFSNLRHPFSNFVLNIQEYYRVSLGQIHPQGLARVMHFESGCLERSVFWVSDEIVPFKMVWRHSDVVLNKPEPSAVEINTRFLETLRECPSRVRPFPEPLLVLLGISKLWDKPDRDPVLMRDGQGMHLFCCAMMFLFSSDDTSDVVFEDDAAIPGEDAVARGSEHRFEGSGYVSEGGVEKGKEKVLVIAGKKKKLVKKGVAPTIQGSSGKRVEGLEEPEAEEVYIPNWGVKVGDSFKDPAVCADVLAHFAPPGV